LILGLAPQALFCHLLRRFQSTCFTLTCIAGSLLQRAVSLLQRYGITEVRGVNPKSAKRTKA
jgi:hypothetical protein